MTDKKMVRGNVTLLAAFPEAVADWTKPTPAELNKLFTFDATNVDNMVFNISCAVEDGYTLGLTDPSTTSKRSVCDVSEVQTPTYDNYEASFDLFRDEDQTAKGLYNMARELFLGPDIVFIMIERIGKSNSAPFAAGDVISAYRFRTDYPLDVVEDNEVIMTGIRPKATGDAPLVNYELEA